MQLRSFFVIISTFALAHNHAIHSGTKHMVLDLFFVREQVFAKHLQVVRVPAIDQRADFLTTTLIPANFTTYRSKLRVVEKHSANPS